MSNRNLYKDKALRCAKQGIMVSVLLLTLCCGHSAMLFNTSFPKAGSRFIPDVAPVTSFGVTLGMNLGHAAIADDVFVAHSSY